MWTTNLEKEQNKIIQFIEKNKILSKQEKSWYAKLVNDSFFILSNSKWKISKQEYLNLERDIVRLFIDIKSNIERRQLKTSVETAKIYENYRDVWYLWEKHGILRWTRKELWNIERMQIMYRNSLSEIMWEINEKALWKKDEILWYNNKDWHYNIKVSEFEKTIWAKSIYDINSKAFASYIGYLNFKKKSSSQIIEVLISKLWWWSVELWAHKLSKLRDLWKEKWDTIAEWILREKWLGYIIDWITNNSQISEILTLTTPKTQENIINEFTKNPTKFKELLIQDKNLRKFVLENNKTFSWLESKDTNYLFILSYAIDAEIKEKKSDLIKKISSYIQNKEKEKLANELVENLLKTTSPISLIKIVKEFNSKYKTNIPLSKNWIWWIISLILNLKITEVRQNQVINVSRLTVEREKAKKSWDKAKEESVIRQIIEEETKAKDAIKKVDRSLVITRQLREEDYKIIEKELEKWTDNKAILEILRKQNKSLDNAIINLDNNKENTEVLKSWYEVIRNHSNWNIETLKYEKNWKVKEIDDLSANEKNLILNDKENWLNIIMFKETIESLKLWFLWKFRESIFKVIRSKFVSFNELDTYYLTEDEIKLFLISILNSLWYWNEDDLRKKDIRKYIQSIQINKWVDTITWLSFLEKSFYDNFIKWKWTNWSNKLNEKEFERLLSSKKES